MVECESSSEHSVERRQRLYRLQAIILRRRDVGEADRIVTLFSAERGKCRLMARGARRPTSRLAGHLEPFHASRLLVAQTRGLDIISQAETDAAFSRLRTREVAIATAGYLAELVDVLLPEEQANRAVYDLLYAALELLEQDNDPRAVTHVFEMGLLRHTGYRPELQNCVMCQAVIRPEHNGFSADGGVVCGMCMSIRPDARAISLNALKVLRAIDRGDVEHVLRLRIPRAIWLEIDEVLTRYFVRILGREFVARRVISELQLDSVDLE